MPTPNNNTKAAKLLPALGPDGLPLHSPDEYVASLPAERWRAEYEDALTGVRIYGQRMRDAGLPPQERQRVEAKAEFWRKVAQLIAAQMEQGAGQPVSV